MTMSDALLDQPDEEVHDSLHAAAQRLVLAKRHAILLVEDTAAHAALIRRALPASIWNIEHVTRAESALRAFEQDSNRIVVLDLSLPDSNGLVLLTRLKQINPEAPIVVVTATDQVRVSVEAMQRGAWDYVVKSDPKDSTDQIVSALERAWRMRLRAAENGLIDQSRLVELVRSQRLEAIESVVRTVCSEVNNPLSGVMALTQLLQKQDNLDGDLKRLADGIVHSATEVARVVDKLKNINGDQEQPVDARLTDVPQQVE